MTHPFSVTGLICSFIECDMTYDSASQHALQHAATHCNTPHACLRTRHREWARERQSACTRTSEGTAHTSDIDDTQQRHTYQDARATEMTRQKRLAIQDTRDTNMGWLCSVGSIKSRVSFAEYTLFCRSLLQKRLIILRSRLIVANPYMYILPTCFTYVRINNAYMGIRIYIHECMYVWMCVVFQSKRMWCFKPPTSFNYVWRHNAHMYICIYRVAKTHRIP